VHVQGAPDTRDLLVFADAAVLALARLVRPKPHPALPGGREDGYHEAGAALVVFEGLRHVGAGAGGVVAALRGHVRVYARFL